MQFSLEINIYSKAKKSRNKNCFEEYQRCIICSDIVALVCWLLWECYRKVRQLNNDLVRQLATNWLHTATNTAIKQLFKLYSCWLDLKNIYMFVSSQLVRCDGRWLVERSSMGQMGQQWSGLDIIHTSYHHQYSLFRIMQLQ